MPPPAGRHRRARPPPSPRSAPQSSRPAITLLVYLPRSCSQPLRFQRVADPRLMAPIHDHRNTERTLFSIGLRNVHAPNRQRVPGRAACGARAPPSPPWSATTGRPRPSIPAVRRPALRWVTCRTLISVFDQDLSIIFCSDRTVAQSCSRVALKILRRSLITFSSWTRQSMASQSSTSSGPFTVNGVQLAPRFQKLSASVFKGSPAHVSALSGPAARTGIRPVPHDHRLEQRHVWRVPVAFRPPASASWASCPAEGFRPSYDRPTGPDGPDPDGVSTFHAYEIRPGWAPPIPRGQRCSHDRLSLSGRRLPPLPAARPYHPGLHPVVQGLK